MKTALIQTRAQADPARNAEKLLSLIATAAARGAQVVCLQELCLSLYFCQTQEEKHFNLAVSVPGPETDLFADCARRHGIVLVLPVFEKRAPGLFHNSAVVFNPDGTQAGLYRKMHIPHDPGFCEKYYFSPGDLGYRVFQTPFGRVGVLICWDQWFPEAARITALLGADIIFYPTAIGSLASETAAQAAAQKEAWTTAQRAHAIAGGVYVAACNRVGTEGQIRFWGSSFVSDPFGAVTALASDENEEILLASCPLEKIEETRRTWPFLRDRRVDSYGSILKVFGDHGTLS